jgi:hypothetical protein
VTPVRADGQWAHVVQAWPGLLAAAFARQDPADAARWDLVRDLAGAADAAAATAPAAPPTVGTCAALGLLEDAARHGVPREACAVLGTVRAAAGGVLVGGPAGPASADGDAAGALVGTGAPLPDLGRGPLLDRFDAIRAQRPWPTNPVYEHIAAGLYRPEQVAVYLDQWQLHLLTGPALFAAILGHLPSGHPDRVRLAGDITAGVGADDRRTYLAGTLRRLRETLTGAPGAQPLEPLVETRGHLGLMRSITRGRSSEEGFAAVVALKPGFAETCTRIAEALVGHYGVAESDAEFFTHQAARGDTGEHETAAILRVAGRDEATDDALATAFAAGLSSYHLILDGCHRAALEI